MAVGEAKLKTNLWLKMLRKKYEEALPHAGTLFQTSEMLLNGKSRMVSSKQILNTAMNPILPMSLKKLRLTPPLILLRDSVSPALGKQRQ